MFKKDTKVSLIEADCELYHLLNFIKRGDLSGDFKQMDTQEIVFEYEQFMRTCIKDNLYHPNALWRTKIKEG